MFFDFKAVASACIFGLLCFGGLLASGMFGFVALGVHGLDLAFWVPRIFLGLSWLRVGSKIIDLSVSQRCTAGHFVPLEGRKTGIRHLANGNIQKHTYTQKTKKNLKDQVLNT